MDFTRRINVEVMKLGAIQYNIVKEDSYPIESSDVDAGQGLWCKYSVLESFPECLVIS